MGKYYDYDLPEAWGGHLDQVFQGIGEGMEGRRKNDLDKQRTASYKAQTDATTANIKRKQQQDDINFQQGQEDRRGKITQKINELTAQGRYDEAKALAMSSQFENPATHQPEGVTYTEKPAGPAPVAPQAPGPAPKAPDEPVFPSQNPADYNQDNYDKLSNPEEARTKAISRAMGGSTQPPAPGSAQELLAQAEGAHSFGLAERTQQDRARYADESRQHDLNQRDYDSKFAAYQSADAAHKDLEQHPHYILGMPGGRTTEIDPRQAKNASDADARQQADQLRQMALVPGTSDADRREYMRVANQIELRLPAAASGAINNAASATQAQGATDARLDKSLASAKEIAAGHDTAKVKAAGLSGGGGKASGDLSELLHMKAMSLGPNGEILDPDINSKIAARAAQLHIPPGGKNGWSGPVAEVIRGPAVAARQRRAEEGLGGTDAEGNKLGTYTNPTTAREGNKAEISYALVKQRLKEVQAHYAKFGARVLNPQEAQNRQSMFTALQAALRPYNELGGTDASQKLEREIQGASGTPESLRDYVLGMNPEIFDRIGAEADFRHKAAQNVRLKPSSRPNRATNIAAGATGKTTPANLDPKDQDLVKQARDEVAKKGPHAADAAAYLQRLGL